MRVTRVIMLCVVCVYVRYVCTLRNVGAYVCYVVWFLDVDIDLCICSYVLYIRYVRYVCYVCS